MAVDAQARLYTSKRAGLTVVVGGLASAEGIGGPDVLDTLLRLGRPADVIAAAGKLGPLTADAAIGELAPGSPVQATRECFFAGQAWDEAARPLSATISGCGRETPEDKFWAEPLSDWVCARNLLTACCALVMSGKADLAERVATCDGLLEGSTVVLPLARDPRRRNFRVADGMVQERDERLLLRVRDAARASGAETVTEDGFVRLRVPAADTAEVADRVLEVAWRSFADVLPRAASDLGHEAYFAAADTLSQATLALVEHPGRGIKLCPACGKYFLQGARQSTFCCVNCRVAQYRANK